MKIYSKILENIKKNKKQFAVLVDPDKLKKEEISKIAKTANEAKVDFFFVGGALLALLFVANAYAPPPGVAAKADTVVAAENPTLSS